MLHARVVRPHGQGGVTSQNALPAERRPELRQPHPGREGRPGRQLPRRHGAEGVRRDPGGGAAQGGLEERSEAVPAPATSGRGCARPVTRTRPPGPVHDARRQRRLGARVVGEDGLGDLQVPVQRPHVDRPDLRARRRAGGRGMTIFCNSQQISTVPTTLAGFQLNGQPYFGLQRKDIRCFFYEGSSSYGSHALHRPADGRLHRGGGDLEGRRRPGAAPVDALGRARLGRLRARRRCTTSRRASTRAATSPRSTGRATGRAAPR